MNHDDHAKKHGRHAVIMAWSWPCFAMIMVWSWQDHGMVAMFFQTNKFQFPIPEAVMSRSRWNHRSSFYVLSWALITILKPKCMYEKNAYHDLAKFLPKCALFLSGSSVMAIKLLVFTKNSYFVVNSSD